MLDRLVPDKDKGSIWPVDINWDDSGSENGDSEGKEKTDTKPKAMGKRKILVDGNKVLIGSSWQDRMTFDGRNVFFKNPFKEGIDLIKKTKQKRKRNGNSYVKFGGKNWQRSAVNNVAIVMAYCLTP